VSSGSDIIQKNYFPGDISQSDIVPKAKILLDNNFYSFQAVNRDIFRETELVAEQKNLSYDNTQYKAGFTEQT
jgi:hypothetical protein